MSYWGMGIAESDEFCEVYDWFMEEYNAGKEVYEITQAILAEYRHEFDDDDGIMHDVYFSLAKAEWLCCAQSADILHKVQQIIENELNIEFIRSLGATEHDLKKRRNNLNRFWLSLQTPRKSPKKRTAPPINRTLAYLDKGTLFWYRSKLKIYGALVLDRPADDIHLIALTEQLCKEPKRIDEVLDAPVYTVAWFGGLLPIDRIHTIGLVEVSGDYNGRAGRCVGQGVSYLENHGTDGAWAHDGCLLTLPDKVVRDLLIVQNLPDSFRYPDELYGLIDKARAAAKGQEIGDRILFDFEIF